MRLAAWVVCLVTCASCVRGTPPPGSDAPATPAFEVHALHYGTLAQFPVTSLVAGADPSRRLDIALMVWLIRASNAGPRIVLMDAGFYRDKFIARWRPVDYSVEVFPGISSAFGSRASRRVLSTGFRDGVAQEFDGVWRFRRYYRVPLPVNLQPQPNLSSGA